MMNDETNRESDLKIDSLTVSVGFDTSRFRVGQREVEAGLEKLEESAQDAADSIDGLGDKSGEAGSNLSNLGGKLDEAGKKIDGMGSTSAGAGKKVDDLGSSTKDTGSEVDELADSAADAASDIDELGDTAEDAAEDVEELGDASDETAGELDELGDSAADTASDIDELGGAAGEAAEDVEELGDAAEDAAEDVGDLGEELNKLDKTGSKTSKGLGANFDQMARSVRGLSNEVMALMALNKMTGGGYGNAAAKAIDSDTSINRQAKSVGMSPARLNAWGKATELEGGTAEEGRNFIQRVNDAFVGHTIDARQIPELIRNKISSTNPDGTPKQLEEILKDVLDLLSKEPDERKRALVIRDFFGGGAGLTRLAGMGKEGVEASIAKAQHRANLDDQDFQNIDQFSRALREARQNVEGFGNGLLAWAAKMFGPQLEQLNKDHPGAVGAIGTAATVGAPILSWFALKKLFTQAVKAAGAGAAEAAGEQAAASSLRLGGLAATVGFVAGVTPGNAFEKRNDSQFTQVVRDGKVFLVERPDDPYERLDAAKKAGVNADIASIQGGKEPNWRSEQEKIETLKIIRAHERALEFDRTNGESEAPTVEQIQRGQPPRAAQHQAGLAQPPRSLEEMQQRIIYQESRGQDYWRSGKKKGQPVVSSVGARYSRQVMPATAHDPGFGIPPARDESPEEYNRVGDALMKALYSYYNGDAEKAMAAYHSGMGRVNRLVAKARRDGSDWRKGLGPNGRAYIGFDKQQVPQQLLGMNDPANYPGVQQAMIRNDNRRITNTTHIDTLQVTTTGGSPDEMARGAQSALQRHPLRIDGSEYA